MLPCRSARRGPSDAVDVEGGGISDCGLDWLIEDEQDLIISAAVAPGLNCAEIGSGTVAGVAHVSRLERIVRVVRRRWPAPSRTAPSSSVPRATLAAGMWVVVPPGFGQLAVKVVVPLPPGEVPPEAVAIGDGGAGAAM